MFLKCHMVIGLHSHTSARVCLTVSHSCAGRLPDGSCSGVQQWSGSKASKLPPFQCKVATICYCAASRCLSRSVCVLEPHSRGNLIWTTYSTTLFFFDHWPWAHNCGWEVKHQSSRQFHTPLTLTYEHNKEGFDTLEPLHSHQTRRGEFTVFQEVLWELTYFKSLLFIQGISVFISFRLWIEIFWTHQFNPLVKSFSCACRRLFPTRRFYSGIPCWPI